MPLHDATTSLLADLEITLLIRRDDLLDDELSGNKAYKLFFNLRAARDSGCEQILSFGGAYSNHLHALALAGARFGFKTLGVVRGERPETLSPTLEDVQLAGMRLIFVSRDLYQQKSFDELMVSLKQQFGDFFLIPEGGAGLLGARGMSLMGRAIETRLRGDYTAVCIASGTGTSLAGLAAGLASAAADRKPAIGFSVLKGAGDLGTAIAQTYRQLRKEDCVPSNFSGASRDNWRLISGFHAGGYGKKHPRRLFEFWRSFEQETRIPLDPVYTLKMIWGIHCLAAQGYWARGSKIIAIHSGGIQGRRGFLCP